MNQSYRFLVGIDWAKDEHTVCVLDAEQNLIDRRTIKHSGAGVGQLIELLNRLSDGKSDSVGVAIETPRGAVVESLVERGFAVYSLNPKQMDRFRDRHTVAGAKDDRRDAFVMADALRTDLHLFHRVQLDHPLVIRIRELSRTDEDLQQDQVRTGHQLRELLNRYYPQMLALCPGVDEPWFWELLELAPVPAQALKLSNSKLDRILQRHRIRRLNASAIKEALAVPALKLAAGAAEAAAEHVLIVLPMLRLLHEQRNDMQRRIDALLDQMKAEGEFREHRDVEVLLSLPGVGRVITATMLAEASQALAERDYHALRCYAGSAPITRQSGKR